MKSLPASSLQNRHARACAKLAMRATLDTIGGGARAAVLADRLERMGSTIPAQAIVSDVYGRSKGRASREWGAWECPECGSAHLGQDAAAECCAGSVDAFED
jgi:hypothetical protein